MTVIRVLRAFISVFLLAVGVGAIMVAVQMPSRMIPGLTSEIHIAGIGVACFTAIGGILAVIIGAKELHRALTNA